MKPMCVQVMDNAFPQIFVVVMMDIMDQSVPLSVVTVLRQPMILFAQEMDNVLVQIFALAMQVLRISFATISNAQRTIV